MSAKASLAQLAEQLTLNQRVVGSESYGGTINWSLHRCEAAVACTTCDDSSVAPNGVGSPWSQVDGNDLVQSDDCRG